MEEICLNIYYIIIPDEGKAEEPCRFLMKKINYTLVEYLKNPLDVEDVLLLSKKLGLNPGEFVRKNEKILKKTT